MLPFVRLPRGLSGGSCFKQKGGGGMIDGIFMNASLADILYNGNILSGWIYSHEALAYKQRNRCTKVWKKGSLPN